MIQRELATDLCLLSLKMAGMRMMEMVAVKEVNPSIRIRAMAAPDDSAVEGANGLVMEEVEAILCFC